jgi:hypothetical protein
LIFTDTPAVLTILIQSSPQFAIAFAVSVSPNMEKNRPVYSGSHQPIITRELLCESLSSPFEGAQYFLLFSLGQVVNVATTK